MRGARRVPAAAHAALEHGDVNARLGEDDEGGHGEQVELRNVIGPLPLGAAVRVHALARGDGGRQATREAPLAHGTAHDLHALREAHELGRGVEGDALALPHEDRGGIARGRGLAVGARDLDALEVVIRIAELREHVLDTLEQGLDAELLGGVKPLHRLVEGVGGNLERNLIHMQGTPQEGARPRLAPGGGGRRAKGRAQAGEREPSPRYLPRRRRASSRVLLSVLNVPRTALVTVMAPAARMPRIVMQVCSASMTTMMPTGSSSAIMASAT